MMPLFVDAVANLRGRPMRQRSDFYTWPFPNTAGSIGLVDGLSLSYREIYRQMPMVYAAINKLARSVARLPLKAYEGEGKERRRLYQGELAGMMKRPYVGGNPYRGTPYRFKEQLVKNVAVYGPHIVVKLGAQTETDVPDELFPTPPVGWSLGADDTVVWTNPSNGDEYPFARWKVMVYGFYDLEEGKFGTSMLEPLRRELALTDAGQRFALAAFTNGARPSSVLTTDQTIKGADTIKALKSELQNIHGGVDKAFKLAVLQYGLKWESPPQPNFEEAMLVEQRKMVDQYVASVFDVPQPSIGMLDEANFASIDALQNQLYMDSLGHWITMIEETTQAEFVDMIPAFEGQYVEFDMNGVLRGNAEGRYRRYSTGITTGFLTPNEVRTFENLPPSDQPEADQLLFPMNLSGAVGAQASEDAGQEDDTDAGA